MTTGEARDLGPRYITAEDRALVRDESAERVSQSHKVHVLVEESEAPAQPIEPKVAEDYQDAEMVIRQKMTVDRFPPGIGPTAQPQGKDCTPPPPSTSRAKKKQRVGDQLPGLTSDAISKTSPRPSGGIVIREPVGDSRPIVQVGIVRASSSQSEAIWQPNFLGRD